MDKIALLNEILSQNSTDAFARYGLAMAYGAGGDLMAAISQFDRLLMDHPGYTAGYFMAAQTLAKAGRIDDAKARLTDGIKSAERESNTHAAGEMQQMLDELAD